jgi:hypothetical protein
MAYNRVPRRWNSYRPSYRTSDSPPYSNDDRYSSSHPSRRASGSLSPLDSGNPNHIPLPNRNFTKPDSVGAFKAEPDEIEHLMGVTSRAYDVVIHYEEKSMGGTRWSAEDIEQIRSAGYDLEPDVRALHNLRKQGTRQNDRHFVDRLDERVVAMRQYCYYIQDMIKDLEKVPENQKKMGSVVEVKGNGSPGIAIRGVAAAAAAVREAMYLETGQYQGAGETNTRLACFSGTDLSFRHSSRSRSGDTYRQGHL